MVRTVDPGDDIDDEVEDGVDSLAVFFFSASAL